MKDSISGFLSTAPRKLSQRYYPELYRIDVEQLARELDLESEARKLAAAGLPPPDQATLSAPEARTVQRIEKARHDYVEWASGQLARLNEGLARRDVTQMVSEALLADKAFSSKASSVLAQHEHLVDDLGENAAARERELQDFRVHHDLTRPATYPEGSATFARYAILLALIIVEGVANAYFFSLGLESGLIGGFLAAGLFAAVNLVTAFVLGKFAVPFVFHRAPVVNALGIVAACFAVACMIGIGLTIGHFRDALMADAAEPARAAWNALRAAPFGLRDIMSWLLFAISVLFAVFALFDGLSSDDRYPGYGEVARRARQSRDDYLGELAAIRSRLEEIKAEELAAVDRAIKRTRDLIAESASALREKNWARTRMETALIDAENCLGTLLKIFREANQLHRGAAPPPDYFSTRPTLQQLAVPDFDTESDRARIEDQERLAGRLLGELEQIRDRIETSFNACAEKLRPVFDRSENREARAT